LSRARVATITLAAWTLLALMFSLQLRMDAAYSGHPISVGQALALAFAGWYGWALLTPFIVRIARWMPLSGRGIAVHGVLSIAITLLKIAVTSELLRRSGFTARSVSLLVNLPVSIATYWAIAGVTRAVETYRARRRAEIELLRAQIQPHFLFNALHGISELMHEDVDAADRALTRVSELLRATLDTSGRPEITVREEIGMVERYVDIQRVRFGDRLHVAMEIDPALLDRLVPNFILQPLVENAVRHGGGTIAIRARDGMLEVEDNGRGFDPATVHAGMGLSNVRARLEASGARLEITRGTLGGALVRIVVPL
jgi:LytS/YehU family sensor histidine kinase